MFNEIAQSVAWLSKIICREGQWLPYKLAVEKSLKNVSKDF